MYVMDNSTAAVWAVVNIEGRPLPVVGIGGKRAGG